MHKRCRLERFSQFLFGQPDSCYLTQSKLIRQEMRNDTRRTCPKQATPPLEHGDDDTTLQETKSVLVTSRPNAANRLRDFWNLKTVDCCGRLLGYCGMKFPRVEQRLVSRPHAVGELVQKNVTLSGEFSAGICRRRVYFNFARSAWYLGNSRNGSRLLSQSSQVRLVKPH
jgi:hypothetical protein